MCHPQDPLNLSNGLDEEKTFQLQSAEIKHGRIAMVRLLSSIQKFPCSEFFSSELGDFGFGYTGPASFVSQLHSIDKLTPFVCVLCVCLIDTACLPRLHPPWPRLGGTYPLLT